MAGTGGKREGAGRKTGVKNIDKKSVKERLALLGCDYVGYLSAVICNKVPCRVCRGKGKTKFQPANSERFQGERTCQSCWGSKLERISPELAVSAAVQLMARCEPQLKAIELRGELDITLKTMAEKIIAARKARMLQQ